MSPTRLLALVGPTASGKTEASVELAEMLGAEIVSVDSMLVYRGMDVGTAKPTAVQRARVRHHLLDVAEPAERFSVARYQLLAQQAVASISERGRTALLVGGSGLYLRAIVDRLEFPATSPRVRALLEAEVAAIGSERLHGRLAEVDPRAASRIEPTNARRVVRALEVAAVTARPFSSFAAAWDRYPAEAVVAAGVDIPRPILHARIERRVAAIWPGMLAETMSLERSGFAGFLTSTQAIGYAECVAFRAGRLSEDEAVSRTTSRTKALARRQMAWFRRDPRIRWFAAGDAGASAVVGDVRTFLARAPERLEV